MPLNMKVMIVECQKTTYGVFYNLKSNFDLNIYAVDRRLLNM